MSYILARVLDANGRMLESPAPAAMLITDGKPIATYDMDQVFDFALRWITYQASQAKQENVSRAPKEE